MRNAAPRRNVATDQHTGAHNGVHVYAVTRGACASSMDMDTTAGPAVLRAWQQTMTRTNAGTWSRWAFLILMR